MPPISRPSSSTYWAPHATVIRHRRFSELPPYNSLNTADEPFSCNASVLSTSNNSSRQYVDPWDLENYAFIKRHCPVDDVETDYLTSTPALESSQSDFYYMPNYPEDHARYQPDSLLVTDETSGHFAGIEEEDFYNERFEMFNNCSPHLSSSDGYGGYPSPGISPFTPASCLSPKTTDVHDCYEDPPYECSRDCQLYSPSVSLRRATAQPQDSRAPLVYVYESGSRKRKMALPKGDCFRPRDMPESYRSMSRHTGGWHSADVSDEGDSLMDEPVSYSYDDLMYYCDTRSIYSPQVPATQQHFGLSKYGHLKIDYSSSWHSLDRYIMSD